MLKEWKKINGRGKDKVVESLPGKMQYQLGECTTVQNPPKLVFFSVYFELIRFKVMDTH